MPFGLLEEFDGEMLGRLFGAFVGERIAGENDGAQGAILGNGAASLAKRGIPTIAALALGGWLFKKWRDQGRTNAD